MSGFRSLSGVFASAAGSDRGSLRAMGYRSAVRLPPRGVHRAFVGRAVVGEDARRVRSGFGHGEFQRYDKSHCNPTSSRCFVFVGTEQLCQG